MYVFYDATGRLVNCGIASAPIEGFTAPPGETALFLDDTQYAYVAADWTNYSYINGQVTHTPVTPTLAELQSNKQSWLDSVLQDKIAAGFPSSADTTQRTYPIDPLSMGKWTGALAMINAGLAPSQLKIWDINGNPVFLTQSQYKQFAADGFSYFNGIEQAHGDKTQQIAACTAETQLDTIAWPNPNPPSVPTGLTATAGTGEASLSWTANTDVTMISGGGYNVYQNGTRVNATLVTNPAYTATGLTTGTSYSFTVTAVDTDGNESAQCAAVNVTPN